MLRQWTARIDWTLFLLVLPSLAAGLVTMKALGKGADYFFANQIVWAVVGAGVYVLFSLLNWRFLKRSAVLVALYAIGIAALLFLFFQAREVRGAASWITIGGLTIEPSDPIKLVLILLLAKYFSRRHIEIARARHIIVSGLYAAVPMFFVLLQPDFGSAMIIAAIWLGMIVVSGVQKRQLVALFVLVAILFALGWQFGLAPYQKLRVLTFLNPLTDPRGAGYNALQSMIAVGAGRVAGRGVGFGAQSRLGFLPEHETDFIFAAFAEEWGLVGVLVLFLFLALLLARVLSYAFRASTNFEHLVAVGIAVLIGTHAAIHIGMNVGLLPITGITKPFMSYGGSNLITLFAALGILVGLGRQHAAATRPQWQEEAIVQ